MSWRRLALLALGGAACTLDAPPSVPEAPNGGTLVVPDGRSDAQIDQEGYGSGPIDCEATCPRRDPARIEGCHATTLDPRLARHRAHLGEPPSSWVVCYYEVD